MRRLGRRETFHRRQQKGLPRQRRDRFELAIDRRGGARPALGLEVDVNRVPQADKGAVERDARVERLVEQRGVLDQNFERRRDVGVAGSLRAGKSAGKAPQIGQMRRDRFRRRHPDMTLC